MDQEEKSERHEQDSNSPLNPFYLSINNMSKARKEWKWSCVDEEIARFYLKSLHEIKKKERVHTSVGDIRDAQSCGRKVRAHIKMLRK